MSVKELSEEFNVSTKTIQRDFNERLADKLPIEKFGHKWRVKEGYSIDKTLDFEEDLVLDILKELAHSMGESFGSRANSLINRIQNSHESPILSKIEIEDISTKTELLQQLQLAILNHHQVEFHYNSSFRYVEPYKIVTFEGFWYLYAKDIMDSRFKTFYIKDIANAITTDIIFVQDQNALRKIENALNIWFEPNAPSFEVILLASNEIAKYFIRRPLSKNQIIADSLEDGSIEIRLSVSSEHELLYAVKKWQPHLFIKSPKNLAQKMLQLSQSFCKNQIKILLQDKS